MKGHMSRGFGCRALLVLVAAVLIGACSGDDDGGAGNPEGPSNTPPPSGVVSVAGSWTGTSSFQQNGKFFTSNLSGTFRQTDRNVDGTVLFTSPGWSGWSGSFSGQLSGSSPESQFFGIITIRGEPLSGGGTCTGTVQMTGATRANSIRWEAPQLTISPTGTSGGSTVCLGDVFTLVWTFGR